MSATHLPSCAVVVDRHVQKNGGSTLRQIFLRNAMHDGWAFWGYSLHRFERVASALARAIVRADLQVDAAHRSAVCSNWTSRRPVRLLVEHHYSRISNADMLSRFGPSSPVQQVAAQCRCRIVLLTRLRQPLSFYISFYRWTVFWRQAANATEFGASMMEWAPRNLQSSILLRPLDSTWAEYWGVNSEEGLKHRAIYDQFDGPGGRAKRTELRQQLKAFDLVGILERFDETLLLLAEMSGLQHLLYHPDIPVMTGGRWLKQPSARAVCPDWKACEAHIRSTAPFDHELYAEQYASFDAKVRARGPPFQRRLAAFRRSLDAFAKRPQRSLTVVERHRASPTMQHTMLRLDHQKCPLGDGFHAYDACRRVYADTPVRMAWRIFPHFCCSRMRECAARAYISSPQLPPCNPVDWLPSKETMALADVSRMPRFQERLQGKRVRTACSLASRDLQSPCIANCRTQMARVGERMEEDATSPTEAVAATRHVCADSGRGELFEPWKDFQGCEKETMGHRSLLRSSRLGCGVEDWLRINCRSSAII
ncbi:MAG: hypothetical protein SGPRY_007089 [Prymnesium sp.]